ncbi:hypothetical protein GCM10011500_32490 [Mucilaginibacter rubeus]|nr:hypothetical protein GCM10011500_32490 [Mucilaginibacter rubeus]
MDWVIITFGFRQKRYETLDLRQPSVLKKRRPSVSLSEADFWTDVPKGIKQAIQKAEEQLDRGEGIAHDKVMEKIKSRFLNR